MPLENAQYIHQLEASNPAGSDQLAQGDDHLRMIKAVLKATFPNITGPVTKTEEELNATGFSMPIGVITAWFGSAASVPVGWAICNGQTVARSDGEGDITTPDLRDRTIVGAGTLAPQGTAAGASTSSATTGNAGAHTHTISGGAHTHTGEVQGHALTEAQIPAHKHANGVGDNEAGIFTRGTLTSPTPSFRNPDANAGAGATEGWTSTVGGGQEHTHGLQIDESVHTHTVSSEGVHSHSVSVSTIQPSMGLHFIMKV